MAALPAHKAPLSGFLARNVFPDPLTLGLFYREKMRAIHRIAPDAPFRRILEIGGGRSGLTGLLYPRASVVNLDVDASHAAEATNRRHAAAFVCGSATALPFADESFDAVTLFDVIEHVDDDARAAAEVRRVVRPGGWVLLSTPSARWRFPYYRFMRPFCPSRSEIMAAWGHVRGGYSVTEIERLFGSGVTRRAGFINPVTAVNHDLAFSRLPRRARKALSLLISVPTWCAYWLGARLEDGNQIAVAWRAPAGGGAGRRTARQSVAA